MEVRKLRRITLAALVATCTPVALADPSVTLHLAGHPEEGLGGLRDLLGTPPKAGGAGSLTEEKLSAISSWMDNPSQHLGDYRNQKAGGVALTPRNHGDLRHNPVAAARALSGDGTVNPEKLNGTRTHKIQDVSRNSPVSSVDGWQPTAPMKDEAREVLEHLRARGALPKTLPAWVDASGPGIASKSGTQAERVFAQMRAAAAARDTTETAGVLPVRSGVATAKAGAALLVVGVAVESGMLWYRLVQLDEARRLGLLSRPEYELACGEATGEALGSVAGLAVAAVLFVCCPPAGLVAALVLPLAGTVAGGWVATTVFKPDPEYVAARARFHEAFYQRCGPLVLTPEDYARLGIRLADG